MTPMRHLATGGHSWRDLSLTETRPPVGQGLSLSVPQLLLLEFCPALHGDFELIVQ